ncbi:hypothetical protein [Klebsiella variicola]|uniref:hypothetical protein n=1 Tax=Klebsiella variicola TaxID=244366 RepID=UPI001C23A19E|nr:hypothetical protein [Klebsiella variicola]MBU9731529.1 hypothetical protein [Klebsiella variicola]
MKFYIKILPGNHALFNASYNSRLLRQLGNTDAGMSGDSSFHLNNLTAGLNLIGYVCV